MPPANVLWTNTGPENDMGCDLHEHEQPSACRKVEAKNLKSDSSVLKLELKKILPHTLCVTDAEDIILINVALLLDQ